MFKLPIGLIQITLILNKWWIRAFLKTDMVEEIKNGKYIFFKCKNFFLIINFSSKTSFLHIHQIVMSLYDFKDYNFFKIHSNYLNDVYIETIFKKSQSFYPEKLGWIISNKFAIDPKTIFGSILGVYFISVSQIVFE